MWKLPIQEVRGLHALMDARVEYFRAEYEGKGGRIHCRRGCANCCRLPVHSTFLEALAAAGEITHVQGDRLKEHVRRLAAELGEVSDPIGYLRRYRETMNSCPFLDPDGSCGIYPVRPLSCRALLSTRRSDWCGIDLGALHPLEKKAFLSGLDRSVAAFPTHYALAPQEVGREMEGAASLLMARHGGFSLLGNFSLLVWLVRERGLAQMVEVGKDVTMEFLAGEGFGRSFLIQVGS